MVPKFWPEVGIFETQWLVFLYIIYISFMYIHYKVNYIVYYMYRLGFLPFPVAARLLGLRVRILPGAWMSVASIVCCQLEVSASGWSLFQRITTDCDVFECDLETSKLRRRCLTRALEPWKKKRDGSVGIRKDCVIVLVALLVCVRVHNSEVWDSQQYRTTHSVSPVVRRSKVMAVYCEIHSEHMYYFLCVDKICIFERYSIWYI